MKRIVQHAKIVVVQRQIAEYTCDFCHKVCGTKDNPKKTWYGQGRESHYCMRTCGPWSAQETFDTLRSMDA